MTQDYTALKAELRRIAGEMERFLGPPEMAPGPDADDLTDAADAIASLERQLAELRQAIAGKDRQMFRTVTHGQYLEMAQTLHAACDGGRARATTAEAERGRLAAKCERLEKALREILSLEEKGASAHGKWGDAYRTARAALQE